MFDPTRPIVLGLAGKAGSGKTSVANRIAPLAQSGDNLLERALPDAAPLKNFKLFWDHIYFAMPVHKIVSIKQKITGALAHDRQAYEVLDVLLEVYGRSPLWGAPSWATMNKMVNDIVDYPIQSTGKPREFMQWLGTDLMRVHDADCFITHLKRKIEKNFRAFEPSEHMGHYAVVVSDIRFPNEAEAIKSFSNGILVRFDASEEVLDRRLLDRDGRLMDKRLQSHESEMGVEAIPRESFDGIINTDDLDVSTQTTYTRIVVQKVLED